MKPMLEKYLALDTNSSQSTQLASQRKKDHYSHFILRLAFSSTEDLRRRFARLETILFRLRLSTDDMRERATFIQSLNLDWEMVSDEERTMLASELGAMSMSLGHGSRKQQAAEEESWCKVDWDRVPELIESRRVFLKAGKAYVPSREQASMVVSEFSSRLERALEVRKNRPRMKIIVHLTMQGANTARHWQLTARALPRLDEDDRLTPILDHLSKNFVTPDAAYANTESGLSGADINARSIDSLAIAHFPLCMQNLHRSLRRDAHLKHYGRLQYTLFLKGIGLSLEECLLFWRQNFTKITEDTFNKEYRYNVRHAYGDVGGDTNRRGGGYSPYSCQKILTEHPPGPGENHGCPYRHFNVENLTALLQAVGVTDRAVLQGVREDKEKQKFHMACNRYEILTTTSCFLHALSSLSSILLSSYSWLLIYLLYL
jgi:DNA primase large subunit